MATTQIDVREAARAVRVAQEDAGDARDTLYVTIVRAYADGTPVPEIALAARLSRARVYQILNENRDPGSPPLTPAG